MGDFAPYEQVEQLDLAGLVWTARKGPDSPAEYVLKFCAPPGDRLRASAEFQKKLAAISSSLWAPIHHVGVGGAGGAFYVTDQYKWSAQLVFDQKDRFTAVGLSRLCMGVTIAIEQVKAGHQRGHGNLKRSNLLLTDRNLDRAAVMLADPSPPDSPELNDPHGDRRALGRILFELVTGMEFKDYFWPVRSQKKWEALGPEGAKWLDWCNRLLAPPNDATACTLEEFAAELKKAGGGGEAAGSKGVNVKLIGAVAAGVVILGGVGFAVLHGKKPAEPPATVAENTTPAPTVTPQPVTPPTPQPTPQVAPQPAPRPAPPVARQPAPEPVVVEPVPTPPPPVAVVVPKPAPVIPPPEPDPRSSWNIAAVKSGIADVDQIAAEVRKIRETFADVPGVSEALKNIPSDISVGDPTAAIQNAAWPADKTTILQHKADLDSAQARVNELKAADFPGKAWAQAMGALRAIKFTKPRVQAQWDESLADSRVARYSPAALAAGLPGVYQELQKTDLLPIPPDPNVLALAGAKATTFVHGPLNDHFGAFVQTLGGLSPADAMAKATPMIEGLKQLDAAWPGDTAVSANKAIADSYARLFDRAAGAAIAAVLKDPRQAAAAAADFKAQDAKLRGDAAAVGAGVQVVADATAALNATSPPVLAQWEALARDLAAAGPRDGWPDPGAGEPARQVGAVVSALKSSDINELKNDAQSGQPPALLAAVASRWPTAAHGADADTDARIFQAVKKGLGQVPPQTARGVAALWQQRMSAAGSDSAAADHLWELYSSMGIPAPAGLAQAYFNAQLNGLKARTAAGASDAAKKQEIGAFLSKTEPLANLEGLAAIRDIQQKLGNALKEQPGGAGAAGAAGTLPEGFRAAPDVAGDLILPVAYDNADYSVRFKHVAANGSVQAFYLSTTEVPVGLFLALVNSPDKQAMMKKLMTLDIPKKKVGPCAWTDDGAGWIRAKRDNDPWISADYTHWAEGLVAATPSPHMPMQYVSPLAAAYAASLAHCRLPTAAEWSYAYHSDLRDNGDDNASGQTWEALRQKIDNLNKPTKLINPGEEKSLEKSQEELGLGQPFSGPVQRQVHEALWFREIPNGVEASGARLHDMRGNVAEWVRDGQGIFASVKFDGTAIQFRDTSGAAQTAQSQDDPQLADIYLHALRIGLSSVSGAGAADATAQPPAAELHPNSPHHHEYFDVGFRLALDDPSAGGAAGPDLAAIVKGLQPIGQ